MSYGIFGPGLSGKSSLMKILKENGIEDVIDYEKDEMPSADHGHVLVIIMCTRKRVLWEPYMNAASETLHINRIVPVVACADKTNIGERMLAAPIGSFAVNIREGRKTKELSNLIFFLKFPSKMIDYIDGAYVEERKKQELDLCKERDKLRRKQKRTLKKNPDESGWCVA